MSLSQLEIPSPIDGADGCRCPACRAGIKLVGRPHQIARGESGLPAYVVETYLRRWLKIPARMKFPARLNIRLTGQGDIADQGPLLIEWDGTGGTGDNWQQTKAPAPAETLDIVADAIPSSGGDRDGRCVTARIAFAFDDKAPDPLSTLRLAIGFRAGEHGAGCQVEELKIVSLDPFELVGRLNTLCASCGGSKVKNLIPTGLWLVEATEFAAAAAAKPEVR